MSFEEYIKYYFQRNIKVKDLTEEQYEFAIAAWEEEYGAAAMVEGMEAM